jgi:hypothetical protein
MSKSNNFMGEGNIKVSKDGLCLPTFKLSTNLTYKNDNVIPKLPKNQLNYLVKIGVLNKKNRIVIPKSFKYNRAIHSDRIISIFDANKHPESIILYNYIMQRMIINKEDLGGSAGWGQYYVTEVTKAAKTIFMASLPDNKNVPSRIKRLVAYFFV